jgi:hypothetical protein
MKLSGAIASPPGTANEYPKKLLRMPLLKSDKVLHSEFQTQRFEKYPTGCYEH